MTAANLHLNGSFEWSSFFKNAFLIYLSKGGYFVWGGLQGKLDPTLIHFHSIEHFISEIKDHDTCKIFANHVESVSTETSTVEQ